MNFSEIYPQIAQVAMSYHYRKSPDLLIKLQQWLEKTLRWLHDFLASWQIIIPGLTDSRMASNVLQLSLCAVGVLCLAVLLVMLWARLRQLKIQAQIASKGQATFTQLVSATAWRAEAERQASAANWRQACRAAYLCSLYLFEERHILSFSPSRTNYEYWYALVQKPILAKTFRNLANLVESVWFGGKSAGPDEFQLSLNWLEAIDKESATTTGQSQPTASGVTGNAH